MINKLSSIVTDKTLLRYIIVGIFSTLTHYLIFIALYLAVGISVAVSTIIGFIGSWCVAYLMNYKYTFESKNSHANTVLRYSIVTVLGLVLNVIIMKSLVEGLDVHINIAFLVMSFVVFANNFFLSRKFVF